MSSPSKPRIAIAASLIVSGIFHFITPTVFERLIPKQFPGTKRNWVYFFGALESATGAVLLRNELSG